MRGPLDWHWGEGSRAQLEARPQGICSPLRVGGAPHRRQSPLVTVAGSPAGLVTTSSVG